MSFDDPEESELYFQVLAKLGVLTNAVSETILTFEINVDEFASKFPARIDVTIEGMAVTISRFVHGGKNSTQGNSFRLVQELYSKMESVYILSIDSDIILHKNALNNFVAHAQSHPDFTAAPRLLTCTG